MDNDISPYHLLLDALQYSKDAAIFYLVPNDGNVVDFRLAYELGLLETNPQQRDGLDRIVLVLANTVLLLRAMQAYRLEHPNKLIILRIYTVMPTSFLEPAEKIILPASMGPMCVIGRGRSSTHASLFGGKTPMLATLHSDCMFDGIPFSRLMQEPKNGFFVSGVAFAQSTTEVIGQLAAGGLLAFTVTALLGAPIVAGLAGVGLAVGALYIPAGTTVKYMLSLGAARLGGRIAAYFNNRPHLIESFNVPGQNRAFRRIMPRDIYGTMRRGQPLGEEDAQATDPEPPRYSNRFSIPSPDAVTQIQVLDDEAPPESSPVHSTSEDEASGTETSQVTDSTHAFSNGIGAKESVSPVFETESESESEPDAKKEDFRFIYGEDIVRPATRREISRPLCYREESNDDHHVEDPSPAKRSKFRQAMKRLDRYKDKIKGKGKGKAERIDIL